MFEKSSFDLKNEKKQTFNFLHVTFFIKYRINILSAFPSRCNKTKLFETLASFSDVRICKPYKQLYYRKKRTLFEKNSSKKIMFKPHSI